MNDKLKYIRANDGKYYRFNIEINGEYCCENNIIISDGNVITEYRDNSERYILIDEYVIDLKDKIIRPFNNNKYDYSFVDSIYDVGIINKIEVTKNGNNKIITFNYKDNKQVKIEIDKNNTIVGYENKYVGKIGRYFMPFNKNLSSISLPQVQTIGDDFLIRNEKMSSISLLKVQEIGSSFLPYAQQLSEIMLPEVKVIKYHFLRYNNLIDKEKIIQEMEERNVQTNNSRSK